MPVIWEKTNYTGVRYYEHHERRVAFGTVKRPDRYYTIRYQANGKRIEEGLGWHSEGWTPEKAFSKLTELKEAARTKKPDAPTRLSEERRMNAERKQQAEEQRRIQQLERERLERENITFERFFYDTYWPTLSTHRKEGSQIHDESHYRLWMRDIIGHKPIKDVCRLDLERIKKRMQDAGKAPRTIQYVFATFRQTWNMAKHEKIVREDSPTKAVKLPKFDNMRTRFLSREEADGIIAYLEEHDPPTAQMAAFSLYSGIRAGDIFNLRWKDIDRDAGTIFIRRPKNSESRYVFINEPLAKLLDSMGAGEPDKLLFSVKKGPRKGLHYKEIPDSFNRAVNHLGLNDNVTERKDKIVFHSCRHSFTSWLVIDTPLHTITKLTGHKTLAMAKRYAHLSDDTLRATANKLKPLESRLDPQTSNVVPITDRKRKA